MSNLTKVTFTVTAPLMHGEDVVLSGNCMSLGSFSNSIKLFTTPESYPVWKTNHAIAVPRGFLLKYRYGVSSGGHIQWEKVDDRQLIPQSSKGKTIDIFGELTESQRRKMLRASSDRAIRTKTSSLGHSRSLSDAAPRQQPSRTLFDPLPSIPATSVDSHEDLDDENSSCSGAGAGAGAGTSSGADFSSDDQSASPTRSGITPEFVNPPSLKATPALPSPLMVGNMMDNAFASSGSLPFSGEIPVEKLMESRTLYIASYHLPIILRRVPIPERTEPTTLGDGETFSLPEPPTLPAPISSAVGVDPTCAPTRTPTRVRADSPSGTAFRWVAEWDEDNFIAKSPESSIADRFNVVWIGFVTRRCLDRARSSASRSPRTSRAASASLPVASPPDPRLAGLQSETAGVEPPVTLDFSDSDDEEIVEGADDCDAIVFSPEDQAAVRAELAKLNVVPVFAEPMDHCLFDQYCANLITPALHNIISTSTRGRSALTKLKDGWGVFEKMSRTIAHQVKTLYKEGDVVWTYGFELLEFPRQLSLLIPSRPPQIMFLNSPFPTSEVFRSLSIRHNLLNGLLAADVVGFHTFNHARHFMQCCKRVAGLTFQSRKGGLLGVEHEGRDVMVAVSHVGIQCGLVSKWMAAVDAAEESRRLRVAHPNKVIIAAFGTCNRLAGICPLLLALEILFTENPIYRTSVVAVIRVVKPLHDNSSRLAAQCSVENYQLVERINAAYPGTIDYQEHTTLSPAVRTGVYHAADVLLHTPLHEGLNLLPMEYVYSRVEWLRQAASESASSEVDVLLTPSPMRRKPHHLSPPMGPTDAPSADTSRELIKHEIDMLTRTEAKKTRTTASVDDSDEETDPSASLAPAEFYVPDALTDTTGILPGPHRAGAVVLSEFATASHVMNSNLLVNPWNVAVFARTIDQCLRMDDHERLVRQLRDCQSITRNPIATWSLQVLSDLLSHRDRMGGGDFLELEQSYLPSHIRSVEVGAAAGEGELSPLDLIATVSAYRNSKKRALFLDYGGTLASLEGSGLYVKERFFDLTTSSDTSVPKEVLQTLARLAADPQTIVCVVTGLSVVAFDNSPLASLDNVGLAAENGRFVSWKRAEAGSEEEPSEREFVAANRVWTRRRASVNQADEDQDWDSVGDAARALMEKYRLRVTGSTILEGESQLVWNHHHSDPDWGSAQALFLKKELEELLGTSPRFKVVAHTEEVVLQFRECSKAEVIREVLSSMADVDFVLALGDDVSDENTFVVLHAMLSDASDSLMSPYAATPVMSAALSPGTADRFMLDTKARPASRPSLHEMLLRRSVGVQEVDPEAGASLAAAQSIIPSKALNTVVTCTVGRKRTNARNFVHHVSDVHHLLGLLAETDSSATTGTAPSPSV